MIESARELDDMLKRAGFAWTAEERGAIIDTVAEWLMLQECKSAELLSWELDERY